MASGHAVPGQQYPAGGGGGGAAANGQHTNSGNGVAAVPDSYFTESRKGEINELRNLLKGFAAERDNSRKRDIIKKVIAYMTLGIDVSRLFTEMMLAIETRYVVVVVVCRRCCCVMFVYYSDCCCCCLRARLCFQTWGRGKSGMVALDWNGLFLVSPLCLSH
jgi:hypothetical protein